MGRERLACGLCLIAAIALPPLITSYCDILAADPGTLRIGGASDGLWTDFDASAFAFPPGPARAVSHRSFGCRQVLVHTERDGRACVQRGLAPGFPFPMYRRITGVNPAPAQGQAWPIAGFERFELLPLRMLANALCFGAVACVLICALRVCFRWPQVPLYACLVFTIGVAQWGAPAGLLLIVTLLAIGWFVPSVLRARKLGVARRRAANGLCVACGYDLRGIAPARCPECGGAIAGSAA